MGSVPGSRIPYSAPVGPRRYSAASRIPGLRGGRWLAGSGGGSRDSAAGWSLFSAVRRVTIALDSADARARMEVDPATGLLDAAHQCPSPNRDARPDPDDVELVIVHGISLPPGEFGGDAIDRLFTNALDPAAHPYFAQIAGLCVSAHLLVRRDGGIVQYVPFHERAWHAGQSIWCGRERCNDFSIGIELEGSDDTPYADAQYECLAAIVKALATAYPRVDPARLAGHADVAPGRKTDPGPAFDWERLAALLASPGKPAR